MHIVGVSSLAAGHLTLVPALREQLAEEGREDIMIVVGGVIPPQDVPTLLDMGAAAVFPPGTVIPDAAHDLVRRARRRPRARAVIDVDAYVKGVLDGKRAIIARAITLVESTQPRSPGAWPRSC